MELFSSRRVTIDHTVLLSISHLDVIFCSYSVLQVC